LLVHDIVSPPGEPVRDDALPLPDALWSCLRRHAVQLAEAPGCRCVRLVSYGACLQLYVAYTDLARAGVDLAAVGARIDAEAGGALFQPARGALAYWGPQRRKAFRRLGYPYWHPAGVSLAWIVPYAREEAADG
jgi:hypothetical protein